MHKAVFAAALLSSLSNVVLAEERNTASPFDSRVEERAVREEPPMLGIHWSREMHGASLARSAGANMTYHGGKIMPTVVSKNSFWGQSRTGYSGDKISGLDEWYLNQHLRFGPSARRRGAEMSLRAALAGPVRTSGSATRKDSPHLGCSGALRTGWLRC